MKKTMTEKQVDFCLNVYSQVQEVLFLRTQFAEDREVIFQLNQQTRSLGASIKSCGRMATTPTTRPNASGL